MAQTLTRAATSTLMCHITLSFLLLKLLLSSKSITHPPPIPSLYFSHYPFTPLSHVVRCLPLAPTLFTSTRCHINHFENSAYSLFNSGSNFNDQLPIEMAPLFSGCDYEH
ncbi:hypothetical protein GOBAR_AA10041 [Gossypium barbadense]|uniref:Uncharacterized protein n=2 Tax=Gossypium TaxID=3633 RepID=A0A2P5Y4S1_GOSBA|nr:hypothetical protein GOBAR_AA10041 [Gossypium barbadense]TYG92639.1 hypothetical protein ES288_A11G048100v1 [Gossypium darwinii]